LVSTTPNIAVLLILRLRRRRLNMANGEEKKERLTMEEYFRRLTPATDTKVLMVEDGNNVEVDLDSEPVLVIVRDLKQFIAKGDVDGFLALFLNDPRIKALNDDERLKLQNTKIVEEGWCVIELEFVLLEYDEYH
jgi:hypothetical protein